MKSADNGRYRIHERPERRGRPALLVHILADSDVSALQEFGLIEKGEKGVLTVPYDEIVIHAGLTEAA